MNAICLRIVPGLLFASLCVSSAHSQQAAQPVVPARAPLATSIASHPTWPAAKSADADTVEHTVAALYDVISGPAGQQRDWDRFRSLFLPDGRLQVIRAEAPAANGQPARKGDVAILTPDAYAERQDGAFKTNGFFERSIANRVEDFGNLTQVWSTYESRHTAADAQPFARGINSVQLAHVQGRYWIVSIIWDAERPGLTLPEKYLK